MPRLIVHLGAHKTGTTLIQKYFDAETNALHRQSVDFIGWHEAHRLINWGNRLEGDPEPFGERISRAVSNGYRTILISYENMLGRPFSTDRAGLYPEAGRFARTLAANCSDFDLEVVFYVRPIADFVESYYLQTIREGAYHDFDEWVGRLAADAFNWAPVIRALDTVFGSDRVSLGDFQEMRHGQDFYLRTFFRRCGLAPPANISYRRMHNPSLSARGLRISLEVNRHLETRKERRAVRKFMEKHFSNSRQERATPMPRELRSDLNDRTSGEYTALAARAADSLHRAIEPVRVPVPERWHLVPTRLKRLLPTRAAPR